jgi:type VI secretion system protein ImpK
MRKEIADIVLPVFRKAIEIKEGVRANERAWDFADSHKKLLALLQTPVPDSLRPDFFGDQRAIDASVGSNRIGYLGIRYALACWLDEIFILDSPWRDKWNDNKVETNLFGMNERAAEFWKQAQRAQTRPNHDGLEAYFLCVMLGFRGDLADKPDEVVSWRVGVENQITQGEDREYSAPPGLSVTPNVRPLKGAAVMGKWFMIATMIALLYIPLIVVWLAYPRN